MPPPFLAGAVALSLCFPAAAGIAQAPGSLAAMARNATLNPQALSHRVAARLGEPKVIHYVVAAPEIVDRYSALSVTDPVIARVIDPGCVRAGQTLGYAVVEGIATGRTTLRLGSQDIELQVTEESIAAYSARIMAPASGAAAWGEIFVSAEWWRPDWPEGDAPSLQIGTGRAIAPEWTNEPQAGPTGLASYRIDLTTLPEGPLSLALIRPGQAAPVDTVNLTVVPTGKLQLIEGECEAAYDLPPLPENRKEPAAKFEKSSKASGGKFWNAASASPRFRFPIDVPEGGGWYQVTLTAGGDPACAALPVVGIAVDDAQYTQTRSSIAAPDFHRVPIGTPVRLDAGRHVLRLEFLNDFYGGRGVDRNLRLDKIEVAALPAATTTPSPSGGEMGMMVSGSSGSAPAMTGDSAMMNADMMAAAPGAAGATLRAERLVLPKLWDGAELTGDYELRGTIQWSRAGDFRTPPPTTRMIINGQEAARQVSAAPRFMISPGLLRPGVNTVQLASDDPTPNRQPALSPVYRVIGSGSTGSPRGWIRRTVWDAGWDPASRALLTAEQSPSERACFGIYSNTTVEFDLPDDLQGHYRIGVEAKGQSHKGNPRLEVSIAYGPGKALAAWTSQSELKVEPIGIVDVPQNWDSHAVVIAESKERRPPAATVELRPGAKRLRLAFVNDVYEPESKGDRNVWVQAFTLSELTDAASQERADLVAKVAWPAAAAQARARGATAAILSVAAAVAPESVEVLIDGRSTGQIVDVRGRPGPYVIPISLRSTEAGSHTLALKVSARSRASTVELPLEVLPANTETTTAYERAVTLLDRLAYGPDERELAAILMLGEDAWLRDRVSQDYSSTDTAAGATLARVRYPDDRNSGDVQRRAILEGLATANPVRARFVLWTENHFSTWIRKAEARRKAGEHERFSAMGIAPFAALLRTSATSPAMLRYLDQEQSFARKLNENYAREIMELHTLGVHGGYTQEDVTTLARILTGWTGARVAADTDATSAGDENGMTEVFRFDPNLGDDQSRAFLGRRFEAAKPDGRYERILTALDMLAGHPSTAKFIAEKLAAHYTTFPPPPELVSHLSSVFESTGGDMRQMLLEMAKHPAFWAVKPGTRLCHPVDFAFRLSRTCRSDDAQAVNEFLNLSGQGMFDRSTPDGYQENDEESMDSNAMLQRWKFSRRLETRLFELVPADLRSGDKPIEDASAQNVIDLIAMRLTGRLLSDRSNTAALDFFRATEGRRDERWRAVATFIASCPEVQVR